MWILELGLSRQVVEVAPVARPGHLRVCGRQKIPGRGSIIESVLLYL
jgi:hypothetical protein